MNFTINLKCSLHLIEMYFKIINFFFLKIQSNIYISKTNFLYLLAYNYDCRPVSRIGLNYSRRELEQSNSNFWTLNQVRYILCTWSVATQNWIVTLKFIGENLKYILPCKMAQQKLHSIIKGEIEATAVISCYGKLKVGQDFTIVVKH